MTTTSEERYAPFSVEPTVTREARIGADVGGTRTRVGVVRGDVVLHRVVRPTPRAGLEALVEMLVALVAEVEAAARTADAAVGPPAGVGVAVPGLVEADGSVVAFAGNVPGLDGVDLAGVLKRRLGRSIVLANDANAAALAEHRHGAGWGEHSLCYLTISTGIGGAICVDGAVVTGERGWAGEFGHMVVDPDGAVCTCGTRGCLETVSSGRAIASAASFALGRELSTADVLVLARKGDPSAQAVVERAARALALGLTNVVRAVDPAVVVLGGGVVASGDWFLNRVRAHLPSFNRSFRAIDLRAARFGDDAGLVGAAALAR